VETTNERKFKIALSLSLSKQQQQQQRQQKHGRRRKKRLVRESHFLFILSLLLRVFLCVLYHLTKHKERDSRLKNFKNNSAVVFSTNLSRCFGLFFQLFFFFFLNFFARFLPENLDVFVSLCSSSKEIYSRRLSLSLSLSFASRSSEYTHIKNHGAFRDDDDT